MIPEDEAAVQNGTIGDQVPVGPRANFVFEDVYEDPLESEHTDLDEIPDRATIEFPECTRTVAIRYLIMRAMVDPDATVTPQGEDAAV
jgi:hypothetical protein